MVRPPIAFNPSAVIPVNAEPSIAGSAAGNLASGIVPEARLEAFRFVRDAPEPLKVVAVITPEI